MLEDKYSELTYTIQLTYSLLCFYVNLSNIHFPLLAQLKMKIWMKEEVNKKKIGQHEGKTQSKHSFTSYFLFIFPPDFKGTVRVIQS